MQPEVTIEKVVNGGYGLAHLPSNQIILVAHVLPGEDVIVTTQVAKKNYLFGKVVQISKSHPGRVTPPCIHYGSCGGCSLQHSSYKLQLQLKDAIIKDLLLRQSHEKLKQAAAQVRSVLPSPIPFHYRQRIRLQVGENGTLGFFQFRSHDIIAIKSCLLATDILNSSLVSLRNDEDAAQLIALSSEVELLENPITGSCVCVFNFARKPRPADIKRANQLCNNISSIERVFFCGKDFPQQGPFHAVNDNTLDNFLTFAYKSPHNGPEKLLLSWEAGSFCQVNLQQNSQLIEKVLELTALSKNETVLDLYCGLGNFSIPLARMAKSVLGIEGQGSAIRSATHNARIAGLANTVFLKQPVHKACDELLRGGKSFDCVILDPPRQGAPGLANILSSLCKRKLLYISCDPATLSRDLAPLLDVGFQIKTILPVDMFPQTHHIETIVLLEK